MATSSALIWRAWSATRATIRASLGPPLSATTARRNDGAVVSDMARHDTTGAMPGRRPGPWLRTVVRDLPARCDPPDGPPRGPPRTGLLPRADTGPPRPRCGDARGAPS